MLYKRGQTAEDNEQETRALSSKEEPVHMDQTKGFALAHSALCSNVAEPCTNWNNNAEVAEPV